MIVVSDNGPIAFLVEIGRIDLLPRLYGAVLVPPAVVEELRRTETPAIVSKWIDNAPTWLSIEAPAQSVDTHRAGRGEREAIQLAKERRGFLLCDDRTAVGHARREGLRVTGTLGIVQAAHIVGWIQIEEALAELRARTEFRFPSDSRLAEIAHEAQVLRPRRGGSEDYERDDA